MPMLRRNFFCLLLAVAMVALGVGGAGAQVPYDTPQLSLVDAGLFRFTLEVRAGASGAPAGFTVEWMKKSDYDALGGWPVGPHPLLIYCQFYGTPTLNLWGATSFLLGPNESAQVQPGDLFDETGIYTNYAYELDPSTWYVIRARADGDGNGDPSAYSGTLTAQTLDGCTKGFWKNHPELWPAGCTPMSLGTVVYTKDELLQIYNQPAEGNGLVFLAHQLITAKLNICNGSDPTPIAQTIMDADALIDGMVVPPIGNGYIAPQDASDLTEMLDDYNNGQLGGVADCPTSIKTITTWGRIKSLYR